MQFHQPLLIEVKGGATSKEELQTYTAKIDESGWEHEALIVGATPFLSGFRNPCCPEPVPIGLMADESQGWVEGFFVHCPCQCGAISFYSIEGGYNCRVCGGYNGGRFMPIEKTIIEPLWVDAQNSVRWRGDDGMDH